MQKHNQILAELDERERHLVLEQIDLATGTIRGTAVSARQVVEAIVEGRETGVNILQQEAARIFCHGHIPSPPPRYLSCND